MYMARRATINSSFSCYFEGWFPLGFIYFSVFVFVFKLQEQLHSFQAHKCLTYVDLDAFL